MFILTIIILNCINWIFADSIIILNPYRWHTRKWYISFASETVCIYRSVYQPSALCSIKSLVCLIRSILRVEMYEVVVPFILFPAIKNDKFITISGLGKGTLWLVVIFNQVKRTSKCGITCYRTQVWRKTDIIVPGGREQLRVSADPVIHSFHSWQNIKQTLGWKLIDDNVNLTIIKFPSGKTPSKLWAEY